MSDTTSTFIKEIETLVRKSAEANKAFLTEGTKFIRQLGSSTGKENVSIQTDLLKDAFNAYVKLNIQHAGHLIDLGLELTKRFNGTVETPPEPANGSPDQEDVSKPAFILKATAPAGTTAKVLFMVDSDKKDPMMCKLVQTDFVYQKDFGVKPGFRTTFIPGTFELLPSGSQKVEIQVKIPATARPGMYESHLQIQGFEEAFFSLFITVSENENAVF